MTDNNDLSPKRILIIEDDKELAELVSLHLKDQNYVTVHCDNGFKGLNTALEGQFDGKQTRVVFFCFRQEEYRPYHLSDCGYAVFCIFYANTIHSQ